jgi:hypothetical protein
MSQTPHRGDIFKSNHSEKTVSFEEAFPAVQSLEMTVEESGPGNAGLGVRRFHRRSFREFINCSNVACAGKGFAAGELLRHLSTHRESFARQMVKCQSQTESGTPCSNTFLVEIKVTYK